MPGELANNLSGLLNSTEIDGIFGSITTAATYPRTYVQFGEWHECSSVGEQREDRYTLESSLPVCPPLSIPTHDTDASALKMIRSCSDFSSLRQYSLSLP